LFDPQQIKDTRTLAFLRRATFVIVAAHVIIFSISGYRAYFQVRSVELNSTERTLHSGSTLRASVVSYARTPVQLTLEMIQGGHSEKLAVRGVRDNEWALYDPRTQSGEVTVALTPELLARFQDGAALVRATAVGCKQWTRLPPPVVRELPVEIQHEAGKSR
jgi:hypothetical protein